MITITLNGQEQTFEKELTIAKLVEQVKPNSKFFAVEKNKEIIQKEDYNEVIVKDKDKLEIVVFVGGG